MKKIRLYNAIKDLFDRSSPLFSTRVSLLLGIFFSLGGIILGSMENSLTLMTNGIISFVDIINSLLFINAVSRSVRTPDYVFNYGYGKYESISILLSSAMLLLVLGYAVYESIYQFGKEEFHGGNYLLLSGFSLLAAILMYFMYKLQKLSAKKFKMPILKYDAELWKSDTYIELAVFGNLLLGALLIHLNFPFVAKQVDSVLAIILTFFALRVPIKGSKEALNQLLDKTLPDDIQFEILAVVAENINEMCEFKTVHTRQSGKDIFIELDIVLPYDHTLDEKYDFEKKVQNQLRIKYPTSISRIYAIACPKDCIINGERRCPYHLNKSK